MRFRTLVRFAVPALFVATDEVPTGPAWFEDVSAARGLAFRHDAGPTGNYDRLETCLRHSV